MFETKKIRIYKNGVRQIKPQVTVFNYGRFWINYGDDTPDQGQVRFFLIDINKWNDGGIITEYRINELDRTIRFRYSGKWDRLEQGLEDIDVDEKYKIKFEREQDFINVLNTLYTGDRNDLV
jgi:hypothetical protein